MPHRGRHPARLGTHFGVLGAYGVRTRHPKNRPDPHHDNGYAVNRLRAWIQARSEEVRLEGLTRDVAIRMRITSRRVPLDGAEPPEILRLRAARPRAAIRQEGAPPRR